VFPEEREFVLSAGNDNQRLQLKLTTKKKSQFELLLGCLEHLARKPDEQKRLMQKWTAVRAHFARTGHKKLFAAPLQVLSQQTTDLQQKKLELGWINRFQGKADCRDCLLNVSS
jgi:hypothetical protein